MPPHDEEPRAFAVGSRPGKRGFGEVWGGRVSDRTTLRSPGFGPGTCGPTGTAAIAPHPQFCPPPLTAGTIEISDPAKTGLRSPPV